MPHPCFKTSGAYAPYAPMLEMLLNSSLHKDNKIMYICQFDKDKGYKLKNFWTFCMKEANLFWTPSPPCIILNLLYSVYFSDIWTK